MLKNFSIFLLKDNYEVRGISDVARKNRTNEALRVGREEPGRVGGVRP